MLLKLGHHATLHVVPLDATEKRDHVVASLGIIKELLEHLDPGAHSALGGLDSDNVEVIANLQLALYELRTGKVDPF